MQVYKIVAKVTHSFAWPNQSPGLITTSLLVEAPP
jgi:hypothetical protein